MDVFEAIEKRRSIKPEHMKRDPVDRSLIERLLAAANWAPSHGHTEPWRFIVFTGDARNELCDALSSTMCDPGQDRLSDDDPRRMKLVKKMSTAPVIIAIVVQPDPNPKIIPHEEVASTAIAVQNVHLAARALGLGGFWSSGEKVFHPKLATFLGIEPPAKCLGLFYVGWPAVPWPEGERGPMEDKVIWRE
jgi:nitroreductase